MGPKGWMVAILILGSGCGEVLVPEDAGQPAADAAIDAGSPDTGDDLDSGASDSGADAGRADLGVADAGTVDGGPPDAGGKVLTLRLSGAGDGEILAPTLGLTCPPDCTAEVPAGQRVALTANPAASSLFVDWSEASCGSATSCNLSVDDHTVVTAQFALRQHRVLVTKDGDGSGTVTSMPAAIDCGQTCEGDWFHGSNLTLSATPDPGSTFVGWTGAGCEALGTAPCAVDVSAPVSVAATFSVNQQRVLVTIDGLGAGRVRSTDARIDCRSGGVGTCQALYNPGASITFVAEPDSGVRFVGWSGACSGNTGCAISVNGNQTVGATFEPILHDVTVSLGGPGSGRVTSSPAGIDCGTTCAASRPEGSSFTLTAAPEPNHRFVGWSGACAGTNPTCNLTVTGDLQTTALFELEPKLVAGFWHVCATNRAGALRCWGDNGVGQLGYGHTDTVGDDETPSAVGDVPVGVAVEGIALGFEHTCAILRGGAVRCWGNGGSGRLGQGDTTSRGASPTSVPSQLPDIALPAPALEVVAGFAHSCALLTTQEVYCWGSNEFGQLGYGGAILEVGSNSGNLPSTAGAVPVGGPVAQLIAGSRMTCARLANGEARCWGDAQLGQLGYGNTNDVGVGANNTPANAGAVPLGGVVAELSPASGAHVCARLTNGDVRCWGSGANGRLGYGSLETIGDDELVTSETPLLVPQPPSAVQAGGAHTCAIFSGLDVRCWGRNLEGALGYGDTTPRGETTNLRPLSLGGLDLGGAISNIVTGGFFTCARYPDDAITCWGDNTRGQLGFGDTMPRGDTSLTTPAQNGPVSVF